ncbi:MAG TPA: GNAT family N-acetyltransferase [Candidatus Dormibacteraeota bacterium]|nr:GNAT family N-acetyltransferase [Candidatus Dormibacteraeota bacterium]
MGARLPGEPVTLGGGDVSMHGAVVATPDCGAQFSLPELLLGDPPVYPLADGAAARRAALASSAPPPDRWFPNLIVTYPGYDAHPAGPAAGDPAAVDRLVARAVGWARDRGLAAAAVLYCPDDEALLRRALARHGFHGAAVTVRCELPLPDGGFDGYLRSLRSHRRVEVRRELARLGAAGVTVSRLALAARVERVVDLRMNLVRAYGGYSDRATEAGRLAALRSAFGDEGLVLVGALADGELIGFSLFLALGDRWYTHWVGQEYGHPAARHVYFACTFYRAVEEMAAAGARFLDVGIGHEQAKAARGCRLRPLEVWVLPLREELRPVAAAAVRLLQP